VVTEARLERVASGLALVTPGWFVVNTAYAATVDNEAYGGVCIFESDEFVLQRRGRWEVQRPEDWDELPWADPR
jgi:hypothetical protein